MKGPGIFLAQFAGLRPEFSQLAPLADWVAGLGYTGVQIPTWEKGHIDLALAAESQAYCDDLKGLLAERGLAVSELSTHLQGQLVAVNPAYGAQVDLFAPEAVRGKPAERTAWAVEQLTLAAKASGRLGLKAHATFSGALLWHAFYPWPQRPAGLVEEGFAELGRRWAPILDAFDEAGVDVCFELHPGEDLHDGVTFERFLDVVHDHPRANILYDPSHMVLQHMDYLAFIDLYHSRIRAFHVKDAELRPTGRSGVYGGFSDWVDRPGRFRSLGDGQIEFSALFSKLVQYDYPGWATLEWECCLKHPEDGAAEGAPFIRRHMIRKTGKAFDDFAGGKGDSELNRRILGLK